MFTDLGNLNEDPKTWGLNRNTYETNEGPKIDISGETPEDKKAPKKKTSILDTPVSETNNMEIINQGDSETEENNNNSNFNISSTPINQGFNF